MNTHQSPKHQQDDDSSNDVNGPSKATTAGEDEWTVVATKKKKFDKPKQGLKRDWGYHKKPTTKKKQSSTYPIKKKKKKTMVAKKPSSPLPTQTQENEQNVQILKRPFAKAKKAKCSAQTCQPSFLSIMMKGVENISNQADVGRQRKTRGPMRAKQRFAKSKSPCLPTAFTPNLPLHSLNDKTPVEESTLEVDRPMPTTVENILDLPTDVLSRGIMSFLKPKDLLSLGACSTTSSQIAGEGFLWKAHFTNDFAGKKMSPASDTEWKMTYQLVASNLDSRMRCFHTKRTFVEDVLGLGVDYSVNPKTRRVDYIAVSQDLTSWTAFHDQKRKSDVFGNEFKLFLPLYFSKEHFQRALPLIRKTIVKLCPDKKTSKFSSDMVLDVMPKIVTTFVVLLSDEGLAASQKSFEGFTRIHRLFLALAEEYPSIKHQAAGRLKMFIAKEDNRIKERCPSLGQILPLLLVVNPKECSWAKIRSAYMQESFDRSVLWVCKKHPHLERTQDETGTTAESAEKGHERVALTLEAMSVPLRLMMFYVYYLGLTCQGTLRERSHKYDAYFFQPQKPVPACKIGNVEEVHEDLNETLNDDVTDETTTSPCSESKEASTGLARPGTEDTLSFERFREQVDLILGVATWQNFFKFVGLAAPKSKDEMARLLRSHVKSSRRKRYHTAGMDFSKIHASGSSKLLAKGQQYCASSDLKRVVFENHWMFEGQTKYLDASCIFYSGHKRVETIDYANTWGFGGAVDHSGDVMEAQSGTHTVNIALEALPRKITSCFFVLSAFDEATLVDIISPSIRFRNSDADPAAEPLCMYNLDSHDKISHLKSVIMCKLYRAKGSNDWHVLAIGDSHRGSADNYGPIYDAIQGLLGANVQNHAKTNSGVDTTADATVNPGAEVSKKNKKGKKKKNSKRANMNRRIHTLLVMLDEISVLLVVISLLSIGMYVMRSPHQSSSFILFLVILPHCVRLLFALGEKATGIFLAALSAWRRC